MSIRSCFFGVNVENEIASQPKPRPSASSSGMSHKANHGVRACVSPYFDFSMPCFENVGPSLAMT